MSRKSALTLRHFSLTKRLLESKSDFSLCMAYLLEAGVARKTFFGKMFFILRNFAKTKNCENEKFRFLENRKTAKIENKKKRQNEKLRKTKSQTAKNIFHRNRKNVFREKTFLFRNFFLSVFHPLQFHPIFLDF